MQFTNVFFAYCRLSYYPDKTWYSEKGGMFKWTELQTYMLVCCDLDASLELFFEWVIVLCIWKKLNYGYVLCKYKMQCIIFLLCLNTCEMYLVFSLQNQNYVRYWTDYFKRKMFITSFSNIYFQILSWHHLTFCASKLDFIR